MKDEAEKFYARDESDIHPSSLIPHPFGEGEDFYTEGASLVFTARYHLRRGYCCKNGCRHCPYRDNERAAVMNDEKSAGEKQVG